MLAEVRGRYVMAKIRKMRRMGFIAGLASNGGCAAHLKQEDIAC